MWLVGCNRKKWYFLRALIQRFQMYMAKILSRERRLQKIFNVQVLLEYHSDTLRL